MHNLNIKELTILYQTLVHLDQIGYLTLEQKKLKSKIRNILNYK
jgi:hypothetical protein